MTQQRMDYAGALRQLEARAQEEATFVRWRRAQHDALMAAHGSSPFLINGAYVEPDQHEIRAALRPPVSEPTIEVTPWSQDAIERAMWEEKRRDEERERRRKKAEQDAIDYAPGGRHAIAEASWRKDPHHWFRGSIAGPKTDPPWNSGYEFTLESEECIRFELRERGCPDVDGVMAQLRRRP